MKLFKNTLQSLTAIVAVVALSASMSAIAVSAATKGSVVYTHGQVVANKQTYGEITSTEAETSMAVYGKAYYETGSYKGQTVKYGPSGGKNTKTERLDINHGSTRGSSYFDYYVDDVKEHSSTEWWNFDFT